MDTKTAPFMSSLTKGGCDFVWLRVEEISCLRLL